MQPCFSLILVTYHFQIRSVVLYLHHEAAETLLEIPKPEAQSNTIL